MLRKIYSEYLKNTLDIYTYILNDSVYDTIMGKGLWKN